MQTYFLSVLTTLPATGGHLVTVYRVECAESLQWVREHADEIATLRSGPGYAALMVGIKDPGGADLPRVRQMACACCGGWTCGRQWPNQDAGYTLCASCVTWQAKRPDYDPATLARNYGALGVHFGLAG